MYNKSSSNQCTLRAALIPQCCTTCCSSRQWARYRRWLLSTLTPTKTVRLQQNQARNRSTSSNCSLIKLCGGDFEQPACCSKVSPALGIALFSGGAVTTKSLIDLKQIVSAALQCPLPPPFLPLPKSAGSINDDRPVISHRCTGKQAHAGE